MTGWPSVNVFYVRGALVWLAIGAIAVALVMALVSVNLLVASVESPRTRHAARLVVAAVIAGSSLAAIHRLVYR